MRGVLKEVHPSLEGKTCFYNMQHEFNIAHSCSKMQYQYIYIILWLYIFKLPINIMVYQFSLSCICSFEKVHFFFNKQYRYKLWRNKMQHVFLKKCNLLPNDIQFGTRSAEKTPKSREIPWNPRPPWAAVLPQFSMGGFGGRWLFDHWCMGRGQPHLHLKLFINDGNHHKHSQPSNGFISWQLFDFSQIFFMRLLPLIGLS